MNTGKILWTITVAVVALLLSACSVLATPVPPTATPVLGIESEVEGTRLLVTAVNEKQEIEPYRAKEGFRFVEVLVQIKQGASPQDVMMWQVALQDAQGQLYDARIRGVGDYAGGADKLSWIFLVPNEVKTFSLILPGDVPVDLAMFAQSR